MKDTIWVLDYEVYNALRFQPAQVHLRGPKRTDGARDVVTMAVERATYDWEPVFFL